MAKSNSKAFGGKSNNNGSRSNSSNSPKQSDAMQIIIKY
ncbi:hypothetical protein EZS27_014342 [termite gut metagenome]|uniref:Uncharacterized protein n=1 Tax=termite gut metagenome TaxID=433724 RepID=A0A5J4RUB0_9ZZZZ